MDRNLYERFGGMETVARVVFDFYERVLRSRRLAPYFAGVDMARLIDHQTKFLSSVLDGKPRYSDAHLRQMHARLAIDEDAFDEMLALMAEAMGACGVAEEESSALLAELRGRRAHIVSSKPADAA